MYKDHPRDQLNVDLIHMVVIGSITGKVYPWDPIKCGLYKQVVFIYRWSRAGLTVYAWADSANTTSTKYWSYCCRLLLPLQVADIG